MVHRHTQTFHTDSVWTTTTSPNPGTDWNCACGAIMFQIRFTSSPLAQYKSRCLRGKEMRSIAQCAANGFDLQAWRCHKPGTQTHDISSTNRCVPANWSGPNRWALSPCDINPLPSGNMAQTIPDAVVSARRLYDYVYALLWAKPYNNATPNGNRKPDHQTGVVRWER